MQVSKGGYVPVIYIFLNKGLGMSSGKLASQAAHASSMSIVNSDKIYRNIWEDSPLKSIITLESRDSFHMNMVQKYLDQRSIYTFLIIDEGINEIDSHEPTALSTPILNRNDEEMMKIFETFKTYKDKIRVSMEIDR